MGITAISIFVKIWLLILSVVIVKDIELIILEMIDDFIFDFYFDEDIFLQAILEFITLTTLLYSVFNI